MTLNNIYEQSRAIYLDSATDTLHNMLSEENWELVSKSPRRKVYRKCDTVYDIIEITHSVSGKYHVTVPLKTSRYAYTTSLDTTDKLFFYISDFIEHYDHYCPENS
tara:strand:- start:4704 stop:5021 length:318 start_codon:yes stop_codon:yes gene_type:complete